MNISQSCIKPNFHPRSGSQKAKSSTRVIIPEYAQDIDTFRETGEFPGDHKHKELSLKDAQRTLDLSRTKFADIQALDESELDLHKGKIGDVKIATSPHGLEYFAAQFSGDTQDGELLIVRNDPSRWYGATSSEYFEYGKGSVDHVEVVNNNGLGLYSSHTEVEYQLAHDEPVKLDKDRPTTITLTPRATSGLHHYRDGFISSPPVSSSSTL